jgi:hypothetical protein
MASIALMETLGLAAFGGLVIVFSTLIITVTVPRGKGVVKYCHGASWERPDREKTPASVRKLRNLASKLRPFVLLDKFAIAQRKHQPKPSPRMVGNASLAEFNATGD